jgi:hypothetical protein
MEKRPVTTTTTKNKVQPIAIKEVEIKEEKDIKQDEAIVIKSDPVKEQEKDIKQDEAVVIKSDPVTEEEIAPVVVEEKVDAIVPEQEEKVDSIVPEQEPVVTEQDISLVTEEPEKQKDDEFINVSPPPVSHPSTCSSAATDEHDAEVAAATQKRPVADSFTFTNSGRSSFSPNSVASLPRPQTPEVDQLRLKFETIIQTTTPVEPQMMRRPSSKMSSEFISRIKEMKPRGPAGARVKSMVELFMDENLNKWEF